MQNAQGLGVQLIVNGQPLQEYVKNGKTYIAAPWDTDFQIRFIVPHIYGYRYPTKRFLAVSSVDGRDIMNGKRATPNAGGYILTPPYHDIPGFRINQNEVASFHFGDRRDSYAAQLDAPDNIGVIGVVFWSENDPEPQQFDCLEGCSPRSMSASKGGFESAGNGHDMGTEFGQRKEHKVTSGSFDHDRQVATFVMEYASVESLTAAGIITPSNPLGKVDPFAGGGCTPPKGWRG